MERSYKKRALLERVMEYVFLAAACVSVLCVALICAFLLANGLPAMGEIGVLKFLSGTRWKPGADIYGIFPMIVGSVYVTAGALLLGVPVALLTAAYLAFFCPKGLYRVLKPAVELLAGIPSVVYGFVGLLVLVRLFLKAGVHTGSCVLAAGILLAVMLLPYLVSSCSETILKAKERYLPAADALGISPWYTVAAVILPASWKNILLSMVLAIGRAMGETMAVMMVMGNANLFPTLLGKGESIAAVIALEMGTAVVGSTHYHALYAAGLVLMVLLFVINVGMTLLRDRLLRREEGGK